MKKALWRFVLTMVVSLLLSGVCLAKQVYLKDGSVIDCQSFSRRGDQIVVKINRDVILDFDQSEVDLRKTFPPVKKHSARRAAQSRKHLRPVQKQASPPKVAPETAQPEAVAVPAPSPVSAGPGVSGAPAVLPKPQAAAPSPSVDALGQAKTAAEKLKHMAASAPGPATAATPAPAPSAGSSAKVGSDEKPLSFAYLSEKEEPEKGGPRASEMMAEAVKNHDPALMVKALAAQKAELLESKEGLLPALRQAAAPLEKYLFPMLLCCLPIIASWWILFQKAGRTALSSLVPILNLYVLLKVAGRPGWWLLLMLIPPIGLICYLLAMVSLAERFGKGAVFAMGLFFLPVLFFPVLAFTGVIVTAPSIPVIIKPTPPAPHP